MEAKRKEMAQQIEIFSNMAEEVKDLEKAGVNKYTSKLNFFI
jgi:hypothetical protein